MKKARDLVDEIIDESIDDRVGIATLLRKCRIVSEQYQNKELREWVQKELNGYEDWKNLPPYRIIEVGAKGFMIGAMGAQINAQPLPSIVMEEEHRHFAEAAFMRDPASSYENLKDEGDGGYRIEWPANLIVKYQTAFISGYALNRAWQDIPAHAMRAIAETVRNRVLEFALSMQKEFGPDLEAENETVSDHITSIVHSVLKSD